MQAVIAYYDGSVWPTFTPMWILTLVLVFKGTGVRCVTARRMHWDNTYFGLVLQRATIEH